MKTIFFLFLLAHLYLCASPITKCSRADEGQPISISCPVNYLIKSIDWVSYGNVVGSCSGYSYGSRHSS